jgi:serine/threonine-protein kinase
MNVSRLHELFTQLLDVPLGERGAFLDRACQGDEALRAEVLALMEHDGAAEERRFLESSASRIPGALPSPPDPLLGAHMGAYELVQTLGAGGMGVVYLGERRDGFTHRAAVKVMRWAAGSADFVRRFRDEIQFLAALGAHRNIAGLIDAGAADDGSPYLVMEYVAGERIDRYCDRRRLDTRRRVDLFRKVCYAVQYAHQNMVIHRDLKPSNILVAQSEEPCLIDFGLAKVLKESPGLPGVDQTEMAGRCFTLQYASPEQVRGERLTTASDVYSLGVILYELLSGRRPYLVEPRRMPEAMLAVTEQTPSNPSSAVRLTPSSNLAPDEEAPTPEEISRVRSATPRRLQRLLAGDLDKIVMTALRKEPHRRYATAEQFSADLGRWLEGMPVTARADTLWYRGAKFLQRHRAGAAAAMIVAVSLVVATFVSLGQARRADRNAQRAGQEATAAQAAARRESEARQVAQRAQTEAERQAEAARQAAQFLVGVFHGSDPIGLAGSRFGSVTGHPDADARDILDEGSQWIESELNEFPVLQATLLDAAGVVYLSLGDLHQAEPRLERALAARRELLPADHPDLARTLAAMGALRYAQGYYERANSRLREALAILEAAPGDHRADAALVRFLLAMVILEPRGSRDEAEELLRSVLAIRQELPQSTPRDLAFAHIGVATVLRFRGETSEALDHIQQAMQLLEKLQDEDPVAQSFATSVRAIVQWKAGNREAATREYRRALELGREAVGEWHPAIQFYEVYLAKLLAEQGDIEGAESLYRDAADRARRIYGQQPRTARTLRDLGAFLMDQDQREEAKLILRESVAIYRETLGADHHAARSAARILAAAEQP